VAVLSIRYIKQTGFKIKYNIVVLLDKKLNFAILTFFFGVFIFLSQLFVGGSLHSSKIQSA
jgi:hypothetical protein